MRRGLIRSLPFVAACVVLAACSAAGQAALGGRLDTIDGDGVHLHARRTSALAATHSSHMLTLANGGIVREYANDGGTVFAISWEGPGRPDLRQLLGEHFAAFQAEASPRAGRMMRRQLDVRRSSLVVHSAGHPGMFRGVAYLPQLVPQGFSFDALP